MLDIDSCACMPCFMGFTYVHHYTCALSFYGCHFPYHTDRTDLGEYPHPATVSRNVRSVRERNVNDHHFSIAVNNCVTSMTNSNTTLTSSIIIITQENDEQEATDVYSHDDGSVSPLLKAFRRDDYQVSLCVSLSHFTVFTRRSTCVANLCFNYPCS